MTEQNPELAEPSRDDAVDSLIWLMTRAGPFGSPRDRAEHLLAAVRNGTGAGNPIRVYLDTLAIAQREVEAGLTDGTHCPCCGQLAKAYHRKLNSGMASALIEVWKRHGVGWAHVPDIAPKVGGDFAKMRHWGLVQESLGLRADGGRQGDWRVTSLGKSFVRGLVTVPSHITVYNNAVSGTDGPAITIREALGSRFNYDELMRGM